MGTSAVCSDNYMRDITQAGHSLNAFLPTVCNGGFDKVVAISVGNEGVEKRAESTRTCRV